MAWFNALVTLQNATTPEDFDSAIGNLESIVDPAKQVRERKFDFSKDYVVLAQLGSALFRRSQLEGDNPTAEREFLSKSAERFTQALALDTEDLDSHYGLKQVYERLSIRVDLPPMSAGEVSVERLKELAKAATSGSANAKDEAAALSQALTAYGRVALNPQKPRLPVLREMLPGLRSAFVAAHGDRGLQDALAASLATLHRELHLIFKPDDIARAKTTREYRAKNPAANAAAEAIVIYPTDREGRK